MSPESAQLLAVIIIVICAVVAAAGAVLVVRAISRSRSGLAGRRAAMFLASEQVRRDAAQIRRQMEDTITTVERMRADAASWDGDIGRWTDSLRAQREGIERLTRGRLAGAIRMAGMLSKAARFALLWR